MLLAALSSLQAAWASDFRQWDDFVRLHITPEGAVVDHAKEGDVTTSEGQSYALFLSLATGDQEGFKRILDYTLEKLAGGTFENSLPAWKYADGRIADSNNATDSDLWIAYSLLEAGRIWNKPEYTALAHQLMNTLKNTVFYRHQYLGTLILPGRNGFVDSTGTVTLNPSYYPPFLMQRLSTEDPDFAQAYQATMAAVIKGSGAGFAGDWIHYTAKGELETRADDTGSWDATRVYLWIGITSEADPVRRILISVYSRIQKEVEFSFRAVDRSSLFTGGMTGDGGEAFKAPFSVLLQGRAALLMRTSTSKTVFDKSQYYAHILTVFAEGYLDSIYRFDSRGRLMVPDHRLRNSSNETAQ